MSAGFRHYYHLFIPAGREHIAHAIWGEHLQALRKSRLCRWLDQMVIGMVGGPIDIEPPPCEHTIRHFDAGYETVTLQLLKEYVDAHDDPRPILYCHSKGVTWPPRTRSFLHMATWRRAMQEDCIGGWQQTVRPVVSGECDLAGPFYLDSDYWSSRWPNFGSASFFAGNFWWASSAYLRRLPPADPVKVDAERYQDRYFAEIWVGMAPHRVFSASKNVWPNWSNCIKTRVRQTLLQMPAGLASAKTALVGAHQGE